MEHSDYIATVKNMLQDAADRGLMFVTCEDDQYEGRDIQLHGNRLVSFSSCSYLGLELHPALIEGACDAARRWGTQFSCSRAYVSATPYRELEDALSQIFGGYALVTSSTTLGHQSTLMTLAGEKDILLLDHQVHTSVHLAAQLARGGGTKVELIKHSRLEDDALERVKELSKQYKTVWFCCDGVYSMFGDLAPVGLLQQMLDVAPNVRLYVDDAHGLSWTGRHGCGSFLSRMPKSPRIVVATSLCKAFGAGGACIILPTAEERDLIKMCGGPQLFSGPMQPPMLGASLASARLHLSDEIYEHQDALRQRVLFCNEKIKELGLPLLAENEAPLFFIQMGAPKVALDVAEAMMEDGFFVNVSMYPAVPLRQAGIRFALTANHSFEEIEQALQRIHHHGMRILEEEGTSLLMLDQVFAKVLPTESRKNISPTEPNQHPTQQPNDAIHNIQTHQPKPRRTKPKKQVLQALTQKHYRSIHDIDRQLWDQHMATIGACSWDAMACWEKIFANNPAPESNWDFHYIIISDKSGQPVCMSFFSEALLKDDMMVRANVSKAVELKRQDDPYFLTSRSLMMGTLCTEGNHLYIDREGPWRQALKMLLESASAIYESANAAILMLRDLPKDDEEMDAFMRDHGLLKTSVLDRHILNIDFPTQEDWLAQLPRSKRRYVSRYMIAPAQQYQRHIYTAENADELPEELMQHLFKLYKNVADRKLRINVFPLPEKIIPTLLRAPSWEVVTFTLPPEAGGPADGLPVAHYIGHIHSGHYTPLFCGLDYQYVETHGAYRQMLPQMVQRGMELGATSMHCGMDADFIKSRTGTEIIESCAYMQARDHFQGSVLREIIANVA